MHQHELGPPRANRQLTKGARPGFALESALLLLVLFGTLVGVATAGIAVYARTSGLEVRAARVSAAAEAGGDQLMAQLDAAMADGQITLGDITALTTPTLPGFTFTQQTFFVGNPSNKPITKGKFRGLFSLEQPITIRVTADDAAGNRASIELGVVVQSVPLFQFGAFFEGDLEITNGPPMTFGGWIHSNKNIYLSSNNANYLSPITAADSVFWNRKDFVLQLPGVFIANDAGTLVNLDFDSRSHPGAAFVTQSNAKFNGRLMSGASGVTALRLPLPTGMSPAELIRPAQVGDPTDVSLVRMANKADLRIVVNLAAPLTNICAEAVFVRAAGRQPLGADCNAIFTFTRDAFYDSREMRNPDVLELDVAALRAHVGLNPAQRQANIIYVEFQNADTNNVARDYPAVRVRNGAALPVPPNATDAGGLTVTTNSALYMQGDFNTVDWRPASLIGDVVTFLSNNWTDANSTVFPRTAAVMPTTVNAALLAGSGVTPCDAFNCGGPQVYSGGLENFPRFLEDWTGTAFNYTGSLVSLFPSRMSRLPWGHNLNGSGYYSPPDRNWSFDSRFLDPKLLPPGTPRLASVATVSYRSVF